MARPLYETEQDREFERFFCEMLVPEYNFVKVPMVYGFDFMSTRTPVIAELKCRRGYAIQQLPNKEMILASQKVKSLESFAFTFKYDPIIFVAGKDGLWSIKAFDFIRDEGGKAKLTIGGRYDRNDKDDVEPQVLYDVTKMQQLYDFDQLLSLRREYNGKIQRAAETIN